MEMADRAIQNGFHYKTRSEDGCERKEKSIVTSLKITAIYLTFRTISYRQAM